MRSVMGVWAGLLYGLLLWLLAQYVLLPTHETPLATVPPVIFLAAHLIYGIVLGWRLCH